MSKSQADALDVMVVKLPPANVVASTALEGSSQTALTTLSAYYELTKPGITKMVVLSASAGYYLGLEQPSVHFAQSGNVANLILTVLGTTFVAAGSCALNNYIERDYDKLMKRTMNRPLPSGKLMPFEAMMFGLAITGLGLFMLSFVHWMVVVLAVITFISYVAIYTPLKRKTTISLLVGGIPGAIPTIGGYVAASGSFGLNGWILFGILFFWQMPHFLSLSWIYKQDYARGRFKMLAVLDEDGSIVARQTLLYIAALTFVTLSLTVIGTTGMVYAVVSFLLCANFFYNAMQFQREVSPVNARKVLISSYFYLLGIIILIFVDKI
jgi:protoheme IX farnesyltransferase